MTPLKPPHVVLVDDNPNDRALVIRELEKEFPGVTVEQAPDAESWARILKGDGCDFIITDFQLRWTTGLKVLEAAKNQWPTCPVIMFTGTGTEEDAVEAMKNGLDDYIVKKPSHFIRLPMAAKAVMEKRRRMRALRNSEQELALALEASNMGVWQWNALSNRVTWDDRLYRQFGIDPGEFDATFEAFLDLVDERDREKVRNRVAAALESASAYRVTYRTRPIDGALKWLADDGRAYVSEDGKAKSMMGISRDITREKRAEAMTVGFNSALTQLAESKSLKEVLTTLATTLEEHSPEMLVSIHLLDPDGKRLNHGAAPRLPEAYNQAIDGVEIGPMVGSCGTAAFENRTVIVEDIETDPLWKDARELALSHGLRACWAIPIISSQGAMMGTFATYYTTRRSPVDSEIALINSAASIARIAIERSNAEHRLVEQAHLLDMATDAIIVRNADKTVAYWNAGAEKLFGVPAADAIGSLITALVLHDPDDLKNALEAAARSGSWSGELTGRRIDGTQFTVLSRWTRLPDSEGKVDRMLSISTDITEMKRLEEQYLRSQRLESIGALASGIAHDLNNILTPILMSTELLKDENLSADGLQTLETVTQSAQRGADVVKQVLMFAGGARGKRLVVSPLLLLRDMHRIIKETFPKNIAIEIDFESTLSGVTADPTQIHQVLLNLCVNARDAMPEGGVLRMSAETVQLDALFCAGQIDSHPGRYVVIQVADSGSGIPEAIRGRIFDPFFSTKETGKGTGLGLATCLAIVKGHGGFIILNSEFGTGTTFKVYLPAVDAATADDLPPPKRNLPRGNGELILIVDDELTILSVVARMLEAFGYKVVTAENGPAAIAIYSKRGNQIAAVLTDLMMPFMDGIALVHVLRKVNPAVKVIVATGLATNETPARAAAAGIEHFLHKPYQAEQVLVALKSLVSK